MRRTEGRGPAPNDGVGRLVRPFALIGGRTQPSQDVFTLITLVITVERPGSATGSAPLLPEHRRILRLCATPTAVVEIAAQLDLTVSVTTIMLSDLLDEGLIIAHPPPHATGDPELALLQKVRDSLARL